MAELRLPGEKKVHWHGSSDPRRRDLIDAVAALPVAGFVVVHAESGANDRRHRRKCLEYLLPNLADLPCGRITFESRGQLDRSDTDLLQKFRAQRIVSADLRIDHAIGRTEPALAVADIVCGAVVRYRVGNPAYLAMLGNAIELHDV